VLALAALLMAAPQPGLADNAPTPAGKDGQPAIGRLNHAGYARRRHCTAFAVAPRVALTATHCLARIAPDRTTLLFGYARMVWLAEGQPLRAVDLGADLAALCLAADAPATLPVAAAAAGPVTAVGYGTPRTHLQHRVACRIAAVAGRDALLDCAGTQGTSAAPATEGAPPAESAIRGSLTVGASGAPVLDADGRAVAVVSRAGPAGAVAATIPANAAAACD
jgi:hypothetical protein